MRITPDSFRKSTHVLPDAPRHRRGLVSIFGSHALVLTLIASTLSIARAAPSPDEAARDKRWNERETPAASAETTARFIELLNFDGDFSSSGLMGRVELRPIAAAIKQGHAEEALKSFETYYYKKLLNPIPGGLTVDDLSAVSSGTAGNGLYPPALWNLKSPPSEIIARAEELLAGQVTFKGKSVEFGPPGHVNWYYPLPYGQVVDPDQPLVFPEPNLVTGGVIVPLAQAYALTHDERFLRAWVAYLDDWSLNATYIDKVNPFSIPDSIHSALSSVTRNLLRQLVALSSVLPDERRPAPTRVFAQALSRVFGPYPLLSIVYLRSNTHNWTPSAELMLTAMLGDEFVTSPLFFREAKRREIEDNAVTQNLRDGTENQQDPWYNDNYANTLSALRLMEAYDRMPVWRQVSWVKEAQRDGRWQDEIREHLKERVTYQIHLRTPQGEWPIPYRGGDKRMANRATRAISPEAYADPINLSVLAVVDGRTDIPPPYDSEWFPYGGYSIVRDGWSPRAGYGAMFCSPQPGAYGGYRSRSNNNVFGLAAGGQDLLVDDSIGHYMYPSSPIRVDGLNQFFHARDGIYKVAGPEAHKVYQVRAWTEPAPWRWDASSAFDLIEGIYAGPYASPNPDKNTKGSYGPDESRQVTLSRGDGIQGVAHQRLATHLRTAGLWIITDRMRSAASHDFDQVWMFPVGATSVPTFKPSDFVIDKAAQLISTESTATVGPASNKVPKVNLTLYQVASQPLTYRSKIVLQDPKNHYMVYGRNEVTATWNASGESQVVTLIQVREGGAARLREFKPYHETTKAGIAGFSAITNDGHEVHYLSAAGGTAPLTTGEVSAEAESLLLAGDTGMVLGASSLRIGDKNVALPMPDCEFTLRDGRLASLTPIYRPISPVIIGPEQTALVDELDVTMSSSTSGVRICYTLDGSDPTPQSALYEGPVRIRRSTVVKARAYRPEVTVNPATTSGTEATPISSAMFTAQRYVQPVPLTRASAAGLLFSYWQDDWKKLWIQADLLKPAVSATVDTLFDLSKVPASNPALGTAAAPRALSYAVQYEGFLDIPVDGIYTFHAPEEYTYPDIDAGYDLRLWVGNKPGREASLNEWYPSTRLHALGSWSIALKKGPQPFKLFFLDYRTDAAKRLNHDGLRPYIWPGVTPSLLVSGPGLARQPIPTSWLKH